MTTWRYVRGVALVALALVAVLARGDGTSVVLVFVLAFGLALAVAPFAERDLRLLRRALPILVFAAVIGLVEVVWNRRLPVVALRTVTVFLALDAVVRLLPWAGLAGRTRPGSAGWTLALFLLFTRHFVAILHSEVERTVRAWRLGAPRRFGPRGLSSLAAVVLSIVNRAWTRAERFYAAQCLRGFSA